MRVLEYLDLTDEDQLEVLLDQGKKIATLKSIDCSYELFAMENFFVEIRLDLGTDTILSLNPFVRGPRLEKFINDIEVNEEYFD